MSGIASAGRRLSGGLARLAVGALLGALIVAVPGGAGAQRRAQADPVTIRLVSQALRIAPSGDLEFVVAVTGDLPAAGGALLAVTAYAQAETRGEVRDARDRRPSGRVIDLDYFDPADPTQVTTDASGNLVLRVGTRVSSAEPPERFLLANAGLYPISLDVFVDDRSVASLTTFVERTDESELSSPVRTVVAARIDSAPTLTPSSTTSISATSRTALDRLGETLGAHPDVPLTVAVRPELTEGLARSTDPADATRLDELRAAFDVDSPNELLAQTYVALDPATSVAGGLGLEFGDQLLHGVDVLGEMLGTTPGRDLWLLDEPIDEASLATLRYLGVSRLLVDSTLRAELPGRDGALGTPAGSNDPPVPSLFSDLVIQERLLSPATDPVLRAYQIVADLMAMSIEAERSGEAESDDPPVPLGLVIDVGDLASVDPTLLDTLLGLLADNPRILLGTGSDLIDELNRETDDADLDEFTTIAPDPLESAIEIAAELSRLRAAISSTASMLDPADPRPDRWAALAEVYPAINLAETTRERYADQLDGELGELRSCVSVATSGRISLGGRESEIPIALVNQCETPLSVSVVLSSPKLELREPARVVLVDGRITFDIPVVAKTNGVFVVTVELRTPGGQPAASLGRPSTFTVRSTALTGLGQVISAALLLVLVTWWIQHARARRRRRRAEAAAAHVNGHPAAGADPPQAVAVGSVITETGVPPETLDE